MQFSVITVQFSVITVQFFVITVQFSKTKQNKTKQNKTKQNKTKQNKHGAALHKVKVAFAWKIWLLSLFLNGKAFTLNKTTKNYVVEWNFQAVSVL